MNRKYTEYRKLLYDIKNTVDYIGIKDTYKLTEKQLNKALKNTYKFFINVEKNIVDGNYFGDLPYKKMLKNEFYNYLFFEINKIKGDKK